MPPTTKRKGATSPAKVPPDVLRQLNAGTLETLTLAEGLAVDFALLMASVRPELAKPLAARLAGVGGITGRMRATGKLLHEALGADGLTELAAHPSDTVRGWAAYLAAEIPGLTVGERLVLVRPLADDPHFGVREWAWLAVRSHVGAELEAALAYLSAWTAEPSPYLRRFAAEATRPRGVWCAHLEPLKQDPQKGLGVLEPLRSDPARYVQDSVANWLNDAAKSRPDWVRALCERWLAESDTPATRYTVKRASRSLK